MKKPIFLLILFSLIGLSFMTAQNLRIMTEENAPFNFTSGSSYKGIAVDLLEIMLKDSGRSETIGNIEILPWARSYQEVQDKPNTLLFSMGRTESREDLFKWVGPIYSLQIGLIAKKDKNVKIGTMSDLKKYSTGTVRDGAPEQLLLKAGAKEGDLDRGSSLDANLKKLIAGRIDIVAFNVPAALYNLKKLGADLSNYEVVYVLKDLDLYYAFHSFTSAAILNSLQKALDKVKQSGEYDSIVAEYLN